MWDVQVMFLVQDHIEDNWMSEYGYVTIERHKTEESAMASLEQFQKFFPFRGGRVVADEQS